jgi:septal ring factor EnvC (AmiA/AmiB activator)
VLLRASQAELSAAAEDTAALSATVRSLQAALAEEQRRGSELAAELDRFKGEAQQGVIAATRAANEARQAVGTALTTLAAVQQAPPQSPPASASSDRALLADLADVRAQVRAGVALPSPVPPGRPLPPRLSLLPTHPGCGPGRTLGRQGRDRCRQRGPRDQSQQGHGRCSAAQEGGVCVVVAEVACCLWLSLSLACPTLDATAAAAAALQLTTAKLPDALSPFTSRLTELERTTAALQAMVAAQAQAQQPAAAALAHVQQRQEAVERSAAAVSQALPQLEARITAQEARLTGCQRDVEGACEGALMLLLLPCAVAPSSLSLYHVAAGLLAARPATAGMIQADALREQASWGG